MRPSGGVIILVLFALSPLIQCQDMTPTSWMDDEDRLTFEDRRRFHELLCRRKPSVPTCRFVDFTRRMYEDELERRRLDDGKEPHRAVGPSDEDYEYQLWIKYEREKAERRRHRTDAADGDGEEFSSASYYHRKGNGNGQDPGIYHFTEYAPNERYRQVYYRPSQPVYYRPAQPVYYYYPQQQQQYYQPNYYSGGGQPFNFGLGSGLNIGWGTGGLGIGSGFGFNIG